MPAGYSSRCKVCNSPRRAEVERWVKEEGVSLREAARRLTEAGEPVSHEAVRRHFGEHFDVRAEARAQYEKSRGRLQKQATKRVSDIEALDEVIGRGLELYRATAAWLGELVRAKGKLSKPLVDLYAAAAGEVRQHIKQKLALLGEDPVDDLSQALLALGEAVEDASQPRGEGQAPAGS